MIVGLPPGGSTDIMGRLIAAKLSELLKRMTGIDMLYVPYKGTGAMRQPEVRERLIAQGAEPLSGPPDELKKLLAREREVWGKVIREAGIKPE